ncbi:MAG TPA: hypothetical protein VED01_15330 [Burkholderiales bacterium]|nr:hypothetical protein [Burkholderiales bacterium]
MFALDTLLAMLNTTMTTLAVVAGVYFMMRYLSRGEAPFASREVEKLKQELEQRLTLLTQEQAKLATAAPSGGLPISEHDRTALLHDLTEGIKSQAAHDVISRIEAAVEEQREENATLTLVQQQSAQTIDRLRQELFSLSKRGNLNLSLGIVTTLTGLALLGMFVLQEPQQTPADPATFVMSFVPRISLVLLIEVFAYFFLRLYKTTLSEIKYFQNEVTSIEAKFLALTVAATSGTSEHLSKIIDYLAQTERNFILNKDQTTVDLERARLDHQERTDVWSKLSDLLKKKES